MVVDEILCMNGGTGETSYAANSTFQNKVMRKVAPLLRKSIGLVWSATESDCLTVADLGCSSGPNALAVLQSIIDAVVSTCRISRVQIPEFNVFMNDLPRNDFNTLFKLLPSFYKKMEDETGARCFISGTPGSFYGRLFPTNFIHFIHSSYSLHWLSEVPKVLVKEDGKGALNKGCIYARKASLPKVLQAYRMQFAKDFTVFLRCRSKEVVHGGRMLLTFIGTHDDEDSFGMKPVNDALNKLAIQGGIDKERLDAFNLPFYCPTIKQVRALIEEEKSFAIECLDTFSLPQAIAPSEHNNEEKIDLVRNAKYMAGNMRAVVESVIVAAIGEVALTDEFMCALEESCVDHLTNTERVGELNLVVSLVRR